MSKRIISILLTAIMIIVLCFSLTACGTETVSLNDYIDITISGGNGYGTAEYALNEQQFREDFDNVEFTEYGKSTDIYDMYAELPTEGLICMVVNRGILECDNGNLSNGDTIKYVWDFTEDYVKDIEDTFNVKLKYSDFEIEAEDIKDISTFDAFENITVEFSGTGPNGTAILNTDNSILGTTDFDIEPTTGLSDGDKVTVTLTKSDDYYAGLLGDVPEEQEKVYTVTGLKNYITDLDQIPEDGLDELKRKTEEVIYEQNEEMENEEYQEIETVNFLGCYLLTPKETLMSVAETYNSIYTVYQVDVILHNKNEDNTDENTFFTYYFYCRFTNGIVENGFLNINTSVYETPEFYNVELIKDVYDKTKSENNQDIQLVYYGYDSLEDLFNDVVESRSDLYNYESNLAD